MSQFIKEFGVIDQTIQNDLFDLIKKDKTDFQKSQLYSSTEDKKFIDVDKRSSQFRLIISKESFDLVESLLEKINELDKTMDYTLFRNNITHIKYQKDDFFEAHEDYLSITSNSLEEYTMIICMDADCDGGETIFYINDFFKYVSKSSVTKNHCMLFRKDLKHAGSILKSGTKNILTMNVWGVPKACDSIVAVKFPSDELPKYFIPTNKIIGTGTLLESFLSFSKSDKKITIYKENTYSEQQFMIINRLYNNMYISIKDFKDNREIIDYYQFTINNILIDATETTLDKNITPTQYTFKDPIIFCATNAHFIHLQEIIKEQKLPYINFKMILAEGSLSYGGEMAGEPPQILNMTPMWVAFSDHNNVLIKSSFVTTGKIIYDVDSISEKANTVINQCLKNTNSENYSGKIVLVDNDTPKKKKKGKKGKNASLAEIHLDPYDVKDGPTMYLGLELCELASENSVIKEMTDDVRTEFGFTEYYRMIDTKYDCEQSPYYDIDKNNKMTITPKHYETIIKKIKESELLEVVKDEVKNIKFVLPQVKHSHETNFCNEDVYGNANFLTVHGFLRLE